MTVIGDRRHLGFELVPVQPTWKSRYEPEEAAWAGTALWVNGENLCRHLVSDSGQVEEFLYLPLAPLANWLVNSMPAVRFEERPKYLRGGRSLHTVVDRWAMLRPPGGMTEDEWLDERESWWVSHFARAGGDGAIVPDFAIARDDEDLVVSWRNRVREQSLIKFISRAGTAAIAWAEAFGVIRELVEYVASTLRSTNHGQLYTWVESDDPAMWCMNSAERRLGLFIGQPMKDLLDLLGETDAQSLALALGLQRGWVDPAESVACQMLRDLSPWIPSEVAKVVVETGRRVSALDVSKHGEWLDVRSLAVEAMRPAGTPEAAGRLVADALRVELDLNADPLAAPEQLLAEWGAVLEHGTEIGGGEMIVGARGGSAGVVRTFDSVRTRTSWGMRFEVCRALGHMLCDPVRAGYIGAASGPYAPGNRRRRSGAFAAEFLLPDAAIARRSEGRLDGLADEDGFRTLLEDYGVGARTAAYHLWNGGWLSSVAVRDGLIDEFATLDAQARR